MPFKIVSMESIYPNLDYFTLKNNAFFYGLEPIAIFLLIIIINLILHKTKKFTSKQV
jgi:hypothetical protein